MPARMSGAPRAGRLPAWLRGNVGYAALVVLTICLIWASIGLHLSQEADQADRAARDDTANFARAFEENVVRSFDAINETLLFVRDSYLRDPTHFDLTTWARQRQFTSGLTFQISVVDADGIVVASNLGPVTDRIDLSDREHIKVQKQASDDKLFISVPVIGRFSGRWSLNVSRRMTDAAGHYAGAVVVSLDPYFMSHLYEALGINNGMVLLAGSDGIVRARAPADAKALGRKLDGNAARQILSGAETGQFSDLSPVDGITRIITYRRVAGYPLIVAVGVDVGEAFASYGREQAEYLLVGGCLTILVAIVGAALLRQRARMLRGQTALTGTLENISQGILMVDAQGGVAVLNRRAVELLGLPKEFITTNPSFREILQWQLEHGEFGPSDSLDPKFHAHLLAGGLTEHFSIYERTRSTGTVLEIRTQKLPDGSAVRTYTDVTARKSNEAALAAARDAAETAGKARSEFLAVMSHEIRTPMNGIIGVAGLLKDMQLGSVERQYVGIILDSGNHLLQLINDILDFSRLEAGRLDLEDSSFEIRRVVRTAVEMLRTEARAKSLDLSLSIAEDVPSRAAGDVRRLRQVLLNLVGNAVKFTGEGGVRVSVTRLRNEPGALRLGFSVSDTGIGIAADAIGRLFNEFTQVDSSISRKFGGSGLGLAISRRLIERMGGSIAVDSTPGVGSTFRFDVLLAEAPPLDDSAEAPEDGPAAAAEPAVAAAAPEAATIGERQYRGRVLVAEDNATNRLVATRMLERLGFGVDSVENGLEAVEAVKSTPYDLVLMDVMMPEMDGLAATTSIRALSGPTSTVPIIGLTANALQADEAACLRAGMDHFATKPISAGRLAQAIEDVQAKRELLQNAPGGDVGGVDTDVLAELARDIGTAPTLELVRLFIEHAPRQFADMREQAGCGQVIELARQAQALGNAARTLGLTRIASACLLVETDPGPGPSGDVRQQPLDRLAALLGAGLRDLRAWRPAPAEQT